MDTGTGTQTQRQRQRWNAGSSSLGLSQINNSKRQEMPDNTASPDWSLKMSKEILLSTTGSGQQDAQRN